MSIKENRCMLGTYDKTIEAKIIFFPTI